MSIKPVNGHLLIEPLKHEGFMASQRETFEEIGTVIDFAEELGGKYEAISLSSTGVDVVQKNAKVQRGEKVYFDSWLAAKYPKNDTEFYWLVKWEDVRAIEASDEK